MSKIKICGLFREEDIEYINIAKPDYVGFIINFPKSYRSLSYDKAKKLIEKVDKNIKTVCVFVNQPIEYVLKYKDICNVIQLHGDEDNEYIESVRNATKEIEIWKAFKIREEKDLVGAIESNADKVLLDNGYGTGEQFDWSVIKDFKRDFILAGGIDVLNVSKAIEKFNPLIIDVSSGVEINNVKNYEKIKRIVDIVKSKNEV